MEKKQTLTYQEFRKAFNEASDIYCVRQYKKGVGIYFPVTGEALATLANDGYTWCFEEELRHFGSDELSLMAEFAATPPELREETTMSKHKTRIYLATGDHVDVQGKYENVMDFLVNDSDYWVDFKLEDGTPVSFQRSWIAYVMKR